MSRRALFIVIALAAVLTAVVTLSGCSNRRFDLSTGPTGTPPVIVKFDADATRLGPPNGSTLDTFLRWDVQGADLRCRIDQTPGQPIGNVPQTGAVQVRPGVTTSYTLSCSNDSGAVARTVTVIVG